MTPSQLNSTRCPWGMSLSIFLKMLETDTTDCIIWPYRKAGKGYGSVGLGGPVGNERREYAHRLSYLRTYGAIPKGLSILHHCDNPPCFNPRHLFAGTLKNNKDDERLKDRLLTGIKNPMAKLTEAQVREIRNLYRPGIYGHGQQALGKLFGVHRINIRKIVRGTTWKHIDAKE